MTRIVAACGGVLGIAAVLALSPAAAHAELISPELLTGWMENLTLSDPTRPAPEIALVDAAGTEHTIEDFLGHVVVLNFFATWCAPCRREMPSLDRLAARLGGDDFAVVGVSQDRKGAEVYQPFLDEVGVTHFETFADPGLRTSRTLRVLGLPATIVLDRQGREVGRMVGPAEWDSDEAVALLRYLIESTRPIKPKDPTADST
jgi:thiol-disulfide isomerase/thioredoxin